LYGYFIIEGGGFLLGGFCARVAFVRVAFILGGLLSWWLFVRGLLSGRWKGGFCPVPIIHE